MAGTSTLHKDLSVVNRLYGSLGSADTATSAVTISAVNYIRKYMGTLPQNAVLVPNASTFLVSTAYADAGAQVTIGSASNATAFFAAADITDATTGWYAASAASMKSGIGAAPLAADTDVFIYYTDTAGTTITAGNGECVLSFAHSLLTADIV